MALDMDIINEFIGRFAGDLGATIAAGGVVTGHKLGLFVALAEGPATPDELAARTGTDARYVTEWLRGQAAGGYVTRAADEDVYSLTEEQAFLLTDPNGPAYLPGAFVLALGALKAEPSITEAFRTGEGFGWHQHDEDVFVGCEQFFRPGYAASLVPELDPGARRRRGQAAGGATVADVGCGLGASSVLLATEYDRSPGSSGPTTTRARSSWPASGRPRPAWPSVRPSRWPRRRRSAGAGTTWSRRSTACTTWATRCLRPGTSASPSTATAPG